MDKYKLKKKAFINGQEVNEIEYDLENLTKSDIDNALMECIKSNHAVVVQETDNMFHAAIFAQAAGLSLNDLNALNAKDYLAIGSKVRNFLFLDLED
jgi:hypothetical protein